MNAPQQTDPWVLLKNMVNTMERLAGAIELLTLATRDVEIRVAHLERALGWHPNERITYEFNPPAITPSQGPPR